MLSKLNSTDVLVNFINSTNTTSGISGGGQIIPVQHICIYIESFQNGNTSEETTDIKRTHKFVQWRSLSYKTRKFEIIQNVLYCTSTGCNNSASHLVTFFCEKPSTDVIGLRCTSSLSVLGNPLRRGRIDPVGLTWFEMAEVQPIFFET